MLSGSWPLILRLFLARLPESISKMEQWQDRMFINHGETWKAHNAPHLVTHNRFIAVHRAFCARRLYLLKGAMCKTRRRIGHQFSTVRTKPIRCQMFVSTINPDHGQQGLFFPAYSCLPYKHDTNSPVLLNCASCYAIREANNLPLSGFVDAHK